MQIKFDNEKPIFMQIAEGIEDGILMGIFEEESQIPSITEFSVQYKINPATALKGINLLVEAAIIYKKRGVGMFVAAGARKQVREKRKEQFYGDYIGALVEEARCLELSREEIVRMIEKGFENE